MSKQKKEILNIIRNSDQHLTAEEVFLKCKESGVSVSIATVYRNLGKLVEGGEVQKVSILGEPDRYDKLLSAHEHIICDRCKKMTDIHIEDLTDILREKSGVDISSYDLSMRYVCSECRKNEEKEKVK